MAVIGVGIDVCELARFEAALERTPALAVRLFTEGERGLPVASLAARFAAKEALAKALGAPRGMDWHDAEVVREGSGRPAFEIRGTVQARADLLGVRHVHLSLSHDAGIASAMVVLEIVIRAHTVEQVRAAEAALLAELPDGVLMQRAASGLASAVLDLLGGGYGRRVLLLVGPGNNGGDALYAGVTLARRGAQVDAWLLADEVHEAGLAALRAAGGRVSSQGRSSRYDVAVDGILGIGGRPGLRGAAVAALQAVNGVPVVAVDVPSGVDVDTGEVDGSHVTADLTVTFGTHKVAHLVDPAAEACGSVHLVDIGLDLPAPALEALQPADVAALVPPSQAHKYTRGVVGVRTGSATYPGAALLSVAGADCGLAGMVRYVGDEAVRDRIRDAHPEVVGDGRVQAWVVGSGSADTAERQLRATLDDLSEGVPVVVDADALQHADLVAGRPSVLTPHAGELAAMLGADRHEIEARPLHFVRAAADAYRTTVLLKGRRTLVAHPGRPVRVTTTGTPWLATAGAGDVLGGLVGALLATGLTPYDAASAGSWLHGAAAVLASRGGPIVATDVARALPGVIRSLHR